MNRIALASVIFAVACGGPNNTGTDGSTPGMDGGHSNIDGGGGVPVDGGTLLPDGRVCQLFEICGDHIDENCDGREDSCANLDGDGFEACRSFEELRAQTCDCDDRHMEVHPGAPEVCDGLDNDCNGVVDDNPECCPACAGLADPRRADNCNGGMCDCSTLDGIGPCPEGLVCCTTGCVDVTSSFANCGFCGAQCTNQSDRCTASNCRCGDGPPCDLNTMCPGPGGC